ncbi:hypothetical protein [Desulfobacula sp.]|uniref:hypothetical protein n=1 Tax=Desulfobacula sp. TaxID=2593537 RepID=UPI0019908E54|nr:hypothetical protein [Deltaproteobacteria bacterium]MBL6995910.1 hypothetical protein [Desulfobacula sp.]
MSDRDLNVQEGSDPIQQKIEKSLGEIDLIQKERSLIKTVEELKALERRIIKMTDKLAGALVARKIQDSIKSKELKNEAALLIKTYPKKMKNRGLRDVTIRPSREEPFRVETTALSFM